MARAAGGRGRRRRTGRDMITCVVRGSGDIGSAIARALALAGHEVAIHDIPAPTYPRRGMAFLDALFDGRAFLEGIEARFAGGLPELARIVMEREAVALTTLDLEDVLEELRADVLVDARMRKRETPEPQRALARLTIGAGPGFVAGETTEVAVETAWGPDLGRVILRGPTRVFGGEPRDISGHSRDRFVYAAQGGLLLANVAPGTRVSAGSVLGRLGGVAIRAPIDGVLVGITRSGLPVRVGTKIAEVDPRGDPHLAFRIGERASRIATGVLEAIDRSGGLIAAARERARFPRVDFASRPGAPASSRGMKR